MHPIIIETLTSVAVDLFQRLMDSPPSQQVSACDEEPGTDGSPQNWQEAYAHVVAYAEEKDKLDKQQSELIVQIAEKVDGVAVAQEQILKRMDDETRTNQWSRTIAVVGGLCGIASLVVVLIRKGT